MPMITLFKTLDVANLVRQNRKHGRKFSMLMCWYIGRADSELQEFYLLPVGEKLMRLDRLAVNTVVSTQDGSINTCGVPFNEELEQFERNDLTLTRQFQDTGAPYDLGGAYMVVGTSALAQTELDGTVNICAGFYNNPFLIWGRYRTASVQTPVPHLLPVPSHSDGREATRRYSWRHSKRKSAV